MIRSSIREAIAACLIAGASAASAQGPELPAGLAIPSQASDGSFQTINRGIGPQMAVWHVRSALNVAALSCHDASQKTLVSDYNALIVKQKRAFQAADAAVRQIYQAQYAGGWRLQHDLYMTRLYNFFSQPLAQADFCHVAVGVAGEARAVPANGFAAFAPGALARLEAPFLALYRRYDDYRQAYAAWQRNVAGGTTAVIAAPPPLLAYSTDLADVASSAPSPAPAAVLPPAPPMLAYAPLPDDGAAPGPVPPRR